MKKIYVLSLFMTFMSIVGCYGDKGNYDYTDIQRIEFEIDEFSYDASVGDTLEVDFTLNQEIDETSANHTFQWALNGKSKPDWNKKKFSWIVDEVVVNGKLELKITDKRNGVVYASRVSVDIIGLYQNDYSWMILSDVGGESRLSYMSTLETEEKDGSNETHIKSARFDEDAYTSNNGGEPLGSGPISLQEHFRGTSNEYYDTQFGQVTVFQQSGAVDLRGEDFIKDIDMEQAFVGGKYPDGVVLHPGTYMDLIDIVTDQNGKIYSRLKSSNLVFHSEYFLHKPRKIEGETEELSQCKIVRGYYATNRFGYAVIYDGKNKRMLAMTNSGHNWSEDLMDAGRIEPIFPFDDDVDLANTISLNDMSGYELLYIKQGQDSYPNYLFQMILRNEATNELYLQNFAAGFKQWSPPVYIKSISCRKIFGLPSTPSCIALPIYDEQDYGFFAVGNTVYMLDMMAMDRPAVPYYVFDSNITAMSFDSVGNMHLAVGLENGGFHVLGAAEARNVKEENKLLYSSPTKVGKIVDIQYKNTNMWNY